MRKRILLAAVGCLGLAAVCLLAYLIKPQPAAVAKGGMAEMRKIVDSHVKAKGAGAKSANRQRRRGEVIGVSRSMFGDLPETERKLCESLQEALDAENVKAAIEVATELMASTNAEVRSHVVDALGWFGESALPELTILMGDQDEDVAQNAISAWESCVSEIDDAEVRFKISGLALKAIVNRDALQSIGSQFSNAATELIDSLDDAEAAFEMRVKVVQEIVDMIASPDLRQSDVGRSLYEDVTGNEWIDVAEAEKYLNDPDNYEPPAADDEAAEVPATTEIAPDGQAGEKDAGQDTGFDK